MNEKVEKNQISFTTIDQNLVDLVWDDKPSFQNSVSGPNFKLYLNLDAI